MMEVCSFMDALRMEMKKKLGKDSKGEKNDRFK
jgi:hypothetical protein